MRERTEWTSILLMSVLWVIREKARMMRQKGSEMSSYTKKIRQLLLRSHSPSLLHMPNLPKTPITPLPAYTWTLLTLPLQTNQELDISNSYKRQITNSNSSLRTQLSTYKNVKPHPLKYPFIILQTQQFQTSAWRFQQRKRDSLSLPPASNLL